MRDVELEKANLRSQIWAKIVSLCSTELPETNGPAHFEIRRLHREKQCNSWFQRGSWVSLRECPCHALRKALIKS